MMSQQQVTTAKIIAHRGASFIAPENTGAAFRQAKKDGACWVEFDVMLCGDGLPIVFHDDSLERTTSGHGLVAETNWADIAKLDAGAWKGDQFAGERVPSLADTMDLLATLNLDANIEIKPTPGTDRQTAEAVVEMINSHWPATLLPPLLSSFSEEALAVVQAMNPKLRRALLVETIPDDWPERMKRLGCQDLHASRGNDRDVIRRVIDSGTAIRLYTVNDPEQANTFLAMGVDALFCDNPGYMLASLL